MRPLARDGYRIGIDTGGTFIDLVLRSPDGKLTLHKQIGSPSDRAGSVIAGLTELGTKVGRTLEELLAQTGVIIHGTTLATNAVLTRTGASIALATTEGLRDTLAMRRGLKEDVFDLRYQAPEPLVPRGLRVGIEERIGADGEVLKPIDVASALEALEDAGALDVQTLAISLMHSWLAPSHECALAAAVRKARPSLEIVASHEILPQIGFYDRTSTTVLTAYTAPILRTYLVGLEGRMRDGGFSGRLFVITSSGGLITPQDAVREAARLVLSGPAAGAVMGAVLARSLDTQDAIIVDMGGTSFDVSMVSGGEPVRTRGGSIDRLRIGFPMVDIKTIAVGGGSIANLERGALALGPRSAGATPGPACYDRGGTEPTITDANIVLGYLDASSFAGSGVTIKRERAEAALRATLGAGFSNDAIGAAEGIRRLAATRLAEVVRRGAATSSLDYRDCPLIVGGGAGPLHACALGREIGARQLIVPASAATLCATGALLLTPRYDAALGIFGPLEDIDAARLRDAIASLEAKISVAVPSEEFGAPLVSCAADLRYKGQEAALETPFSQVEVGREGVAIIRSAFEAEHRRLRGYDLPDEAVEILCVRVTASWSFGQTPLDFGRPAAGAAIPDRDAYDVVAGHVRPFKVYDWHSMVPGDRVVAPTLVLMPGSTCIIEAPYDCVVNADRNLVLTSMDVAPVA